MTSGTLATPYVYALDLGTYFTGQGLPSLHMVIMSKPSDRVAEITDASPAGAHAAEEPSFPAAATEVLFCAVRRTAPPGAIGVGARIGADPCATTSPPALLVQSEQSRRVRMLVSKVVPFGTPGR